MHYPLTIVILSPYGPSDALKQILNSYHYKEKCFYFIGPISDFSTLNRINLATAASVYIVGNNLSVSSRQNEDEIFITTLSIVNYLKMQLQVELQQQFFETSKNTTRTKGLIKG